MGGGGRAGGDGEAGLVVEIGLVEVASFQAQAVRRRYGLLYFLEEGQIRELEEYHCVVRVDVVAAHEYLLLFALFNILCEPVITVHAAATAKKVSLLCGGPQFQLITHLHLLVPLLLLILHLIDVFLEDSYVFLYVGGDGVALLEFEGQVIVLEFEGLIVNLLVIDLFEFVFREHQCLIFEEEAVVSIVELVPETVLLVDEPVLDEAEARHDEIAVLLVFF